MNDILRKKIAHELMMWVPMTEELYVKLDNVRKIFTMDIDEYVRSFPKADLNREIKRLEKRGYIALTKKPDGWLIRLKKKGLRTWKKLQLEKLKFPIANKWDGKWRLLIFDIPEDKKSRRDRLSRKLRELGMYSIQRSSYIYPFDCREELELVTDYYEVTIYGTYGEISKIDIDRDLRKFFSDLI